MSLIAKHFWALSRRDYEQGLYMGAYNFSWPDNLFIKEIDATYENLKPRMDKVSEKWHWNEQPRYSEEELKKKLAEPDTKIYILCDKNDPDVEVGYALISRAKGTLIDRAIFALKKVFRQSVNDIAVLEIDNLASYPGKEGGGRGKAFFEMIFFNHFSKNDVIIWSQHETHHPKLADFYGLTMEMTHVGTEYVPEFRSSHLARMAAE